MPVLLFYSSSSQERGCNKYDSRRKIGRSSELNLVFDSTGLGVGVSDSLGHVYQEGGGGSGVTQD
jgi:hypothetical protein